jgi:hypothetical protein
MALEANFPYVPGEAGSVQRRAPQHHNAAIVSLMKKRVDMKFSSKAIDMVDITTDKSVDAAHGLFFAVAC